MGNRGEQLEVWEIRANSKSNVIRLEKAKTGMRTRRRNGERGAWTCRDGRGLRILCGVEGRGIGVRKARDGIVLGRAKESSSRVHGFGCGMPKHARLGNATARVLQKAQGVILWSTPWIG